MRITGPLLAVAMLAGAVPAVAAPTPSIAGAVAATGARDPDDVKRDASRRLFAAVKPGELVDHVLVFDEASRRQTGRVVQKVRKPR